MLPGVENLKTGQRKLTGFSFLMEVHWMRSAGLVFAKERVRYFLGRSAAQVVGASTAGWRLPFCARGILKPFLGKSIELPFAPGSTLLLFVRKTNVADIPNVREDT